jgi:hypothetical protein
MRHHVVDRRAAVGFVAPRDGSTLQLELAGRGGPVLIDLGGPDKGGSQSEVNGHHHRDMRRSTNARS